MPREYLDISMTTPELHAFLGSFHRLVLATNDRDGGTWGDAVAYHFDGERLHFWLPPSSRSLANVRRDNRVCCVVESHPSGSSYYDIRGALLHGKAEENPAASRPTAPAGVTDPVRHEPLDGMGFSIGLEDVASFNFSKIAYRYQDEPDR
jgi:nitroimidazol reductase NimA-like FMN-containing flavoprotein (pyridoxamine 5'-phosphate oxidase superfamily)